MAREGVHKESLTRTAMRLFRRRGYASTGLQQILAESGAPKGSLYHYFPGGKEALAVAAVEMAGNMVTDMLKKLAESACDDAAAFVRAYSEVMADWMAESDFRSGCPIATVVLETVPDSAAIMAAAAHAIECWTDIADAVFTKAGMPAERAGETARNLVTLMEGALLMARVRQSTQPILAVATAFQFGGNAASANAGQSVGKSAAAEIGGFAS